MSTWEEIAVPDALLDTGVGKQHQVLAQDIAPSGAYPVIDQGQSFIAGYCDDQSRVIDFALPVIIFGDHTRAFKYVDFPFVLGADGTKVLKPDPEQFDARYFYFAMLALDIPNRGYNRHFKILRERSIPKPPLPEQQRIAQVLSMVQEAIAQQERLIRTTTELKQALMQKLFTEGLRGEALKETEIGRVPESWEVVSLEDVMSCHDGKRKPVTQSDRIPGPYPYYGASGVTDHVEGYLFDGDYLLIAEDGENLASRKLPIAFIARGKFWVNNHAHVLSMKRGILDFYEQYIAQMEIKDYLSGTTRPKLNKGLMMTIKLPWPSVAEQNEIATALTACDTKLHTAERKRNALQDLFRTLLHGLMTGKVRVNID